LTKTYGKILASARGARKPRSKFMPSAQLFTYSDFVIYDGGRFYSVAQADVNESFYALRDDYTRLCLAQYFLEMCDKTTPFNAPCDDLLHLLIISLSALAKGIRPAYLIARAFEIKFFQISGLAPETECCAKCGGALRQLIRFGAEGAVCGCYTLPAVRISQAALSAIRYVLTANLNEIFKFSAGQDVLIEIRDAARLFFNHHFDVAIKSLDLLE